MRSREHEGNVVTEAPGSVKFKVVRVVSGVQEKSSRVTALGV